MTPRKRSGRSLTDEERAAAGRERLTLRPRAGFTAELDALRGEVPRTEALERLVAWAHARGWRAG